MISTGVYRVDPARTRVTGTVRHVFGLSPVDGTFQVRSARVTVAEDPRESTVDVVLDAGSFASGNPRRDKDIRAARFLDTARHPDITFHGGDVAEHPDGGWTVRGQLTVRGTRSPLALHLTEVRPDGDGFAATAVARLDRCAAGVRTGRPIIGRYVDLRLSVVAVSAG